MEKTKNPSGNVWMKGLFNGLFAYILGFAVYMLPGIIISVKMGFTLGPQSNDPAALSADISQAISGMYSGSIPLAVLLIVFTSLFIIWRSRTVSKKYGGDAIRNGLFVSAVPVCLTLLFMITGGVDWISVLEIFVYPGAGYLSAVILRNA
ncbi:MAG: hypothetical protein PHX07_01755 [Candidatus Marinimicrobia bacterium]|nr:hypothetical protein [Candidatus Neomarinimicrobiota bacterium]MDD4960939.1 hypothetical protein [Candidatus Neomarinimicrobiota bacterium]MDD5708918.1 hypothetical protein [Candidatus Neomarinimicrobiota bacterium]MDX9777760.1 hypothetical protein [bacterium]